VKRRKDEILKITEEEKPVDREKKIFKTIIKRNKAPQSVKHTLNNL